MDLIPEHVYRSCAEASWEAPGTQRLWDSNQRDTYIELMLARPDWRAIVDAAYRAGRESAARVLDGVYRAGQEVAALAVERFGEQLVCHECGPDVQGFAAAARGDNPGERR